MKNIKKLAAFILSVIMLFSFAACGENGGEQGGENATQQSIEREYKTRIAALNGTSGIGLAKLKLDRAYAYDVQLYSDPGEIVPLIENGETDIAALPLNLAADLYNKTNGGIQMLAINTLGVLHVLSKDDSIKSIADLKGKTVYAAGQGTTSEYIFNYILKQNGIDPAADIDIQYKAGHNELADLAIEGNADICVLPEPYASKVILFNTEMKRVLDLTGEWGKVSEVQLAQECFVARKEYIDAHPDLVAEFLEHSEISANYANSIVYSYTMLVEEGYFDNAAVANEAIEGCNIVSITGEEMKKTASENFNVLFEADAASAGGAVPDEGLYYLG